MSKIYLIEQVYDNGDSYEDHYRETNVIRAFPTLEDAVDFLNELTPDYDNEWGEWEKIPNKKPNIQSFQRKGYVERITESLNYYVTEIPFGKEN